MNKRPYRTPTTPAQVLLLSLLVLLPTPALSEPPQHYYNSAKGLSGQALKSALHSLIDNHQSLPYTASGNADWHDRENVDVWEALTYTDSACPEEAPKCGLVQLLYLNESRHISQAYRGGKPTGDNWDREHVWPKSRGFKKKFQDGYTDLHHIRPADRDLNNAHSNYGYDEGGLPVMDKLTDGRIVETTAKVDRAGQSYEPPDRAKGQVARMLFYMAVRYEAGDDGGSEKMPDLELIDANRKTKKPLIGDLCTLVKWHYKFPVTPFELRRNDRVQELQGNRNPFIDREEFVKGLWGGLCR